MIEGQETFEKEYPSFAAVNRAANGIYIFEKNNASTCKLNKRFLLCRKVVSRHQGKIVKLEYVPSDPSQVDTTLFLVGKGLTYDTGGADIKHGGNMASMHRDKCGAAFVAGFFKTLSLLKPKRIKVYGSLCITRNNIGEGITKIQPNNLYLKHVRSSFNTYRFEIIYLLECYVADEIITARSKKRIRIGNTDAEGRMAMCDVLCEVKDAALNEINPQLFTIATLTGHAVQSYGTSYSVSAGSSTLLSEYLAKFCKRKYFSSKGDYVQRASETAWSRQRLEGKR